MFRATATILLLAAVAGLAAANTKGTRFEGFTYASDVQGYVNMTADYCDITAAISAGNWEEALTIYSTGKNSFSGASRRTFMRFASLVPSAPEPLVDMINYGRNASWIDESIRAAVAAQNGPLTLGLIQVGVLKYFFHEVEEAAAKLSAYVADPTLTIQIDDDRGAPHNVDELFALFAGGVNPNCGTLAGWARTLGKELDAVFVSETVLNSAMVNIFNEMLATSRVGDLDGYNVQRDRLVKTIWVLGVQGVTHSAYKAALAYKCGRTADVAAAQDQLAIHWSYLQPMLAGRKTTPGYQAKWNSNVAAFESALTANPPNYAAVRKALTNILGGSGRSTAEVGTPSFTKINAEWGCPASARP